MSLIIKVHDAACSVTVLYIHIWCTCPRSLGIVYNTRTRRGDSALTVSSCVRYPHVVSVMSDALWYNMFIHYCFLLKSMLYDIYIYIETNISLRLFLLRLRNQTQREMSELRSNSRYSDLKRHEYCVLKDASVIFASCVDFTKSREKLNPICYSDFCSALPESYIKGRWVVFAWRTNKHP